MLNSVGLVLFLAFAACSQTDVERIREINESAATTPIWTVSPPTATPVATTTMGELSADIQATEISEGDCIDSTLPEGITFKSVVIVVCSGPWEYRVLGLFEIEDMNKYPGKEYFGKRAYENCDRRFSYILYPPEESWMLGYRTVSCLQKSFGLSVVDSAKLNHLVHFSSVILGECFNEAPEADWIVVELVSCSGPWEYRVLGLFEVEDLDKYPREDYFERLAYKGCDRRYSYILYPITESWILGYRTVSCLQQSFGLSVVDPAKLDRLVGVDTLDLGECYNEAQETGWLLAELVNCTGPWQYRVLGTFEVTDQDRYPGQSYFEGQAYQNCDRRHSYFAYPLEEHWKFGDRTVICVQESFGLSVVDPAKLDRLVGVKTLRSGECYNEAQETGWLLVELVDCSGPWEYRVLGLFEVEDLDKYPRKDYFERRAYKDCDRRYSYFLYPVQESWILGDRTVSCLQHSFGLSVVDPAKLDHLVNVYTVKAGECFNETPEMGLTLVELVSCSGPWEHQVAKTFIIPWNGEYPGTDHFEQQATKECEGSDYYYAPDRRTWDLDNRVVLCIKASNP